MFEFCLVVSIFSFNEIFFKESISKEGSESIINCAELSIKDTVLALKYSYKADSCRKIYSPKCYSINYSIASDIYLCLIKQIDSNTLVPDRQKDSYIKNHKNLLENFAYCRSCMCFNSIIYEGLLTESIENANKTISELRMLNSEKINFTGLYNNIGIAYRLMSNYDKAITYLDSALRIRKNILGNDHFLVGQSYNNLGSVFFAKEDFEHALYIFELSLNIKLQNNSSIPDLSNTYNNIGNVYYKMSDHQKALENYFKSLDLDKKHSGNYNPSVAITHTNIGLVYSEMANYDSALYYQNLSLEIKHKLLPENHLEFAFSYYNIADLYFLKSDYESSSMFLQKAKEIAEKTLGNKNFYMASIYRKKGDIHLMQKDYSKALSYYQMGIVADIKEDKFEINNTIYSNNNINNDYFKTVVVIDPPEMLKLLNAKANAFYLKWISDLK